MIKLEESDARSSDTSFLFCFCNKCYEFFDTEELLEAHNAAKHIIDNRQSQIRTDGGKPRPAASPTCIAPQPHHSYISVPQAVYHAIPITRTQLEHKCLICGQKYPSTDLLVNHMYTHEDNAETQMLKCTYCDQMSIHSKTHTGEKQFKCSYCQKSFTRIGDRHQRNHWNDKYRCYQCGKIFSKRAYLIAHNKKHKPFECNYCDEAFAREEYLQEHEKIHTS